MSWAGKCNKKPYLEQFERIKRWHRRILNIQKSLGLPDQQIPDPNEEDLEVDTFYAFFMNCYHLRDWLLNSGVVDKSEIKKLFEDNFELKICRDLCNGAKHLELTKPSTAKGPFGVATLHKEYAPTGKRRRYCIIAEGKHDLFGLANNCLKRWEEFLQVKRLL